MNHEKILHITGPTSVTSPIILYNVSTYFIIIIYISNVVLPDQGQRCYLCWWCQKPYQTKRQLSIHRLQEHVDEVYCPYCPFKMESRSICTMYAHLREAHFMKNAPMHPNPQRPPDNCKRPRQYNQEPFNYKKQRPSFGTDRSATWDTSHSVKPFDSELREVMQRQRIMDLQKRYTKGKMQSKRTGSLYSVKMNSDSSSESQCSQSYTSGRPSASPHSHGCSLPSPSLSSISTYQQQLNSPKPESCSSIATEAYESRPNESRATKNIESNNSAEQCDFIIPQTPKSPYYEKWLSEMCTESNISESTALLTENATPIKDSGQFTTATIIADDQFSVISDATIISSKITTRTKTADALLCDQDKVLNLKTGLINQDYSNQSPSQNAECNSSSVQDSPVKRVDPGLVIQKQHNGASEAPAIETQSTDFPICIDLSARVHEEKSTSPAGVVVSPGVPLAQNNIDSSIRQLVCEENKLNVQETMISINDSTESTYQFCEPNDQQISTLSKVVCQTPTKSIGEMHHSPKGGLKCDSNMETFNTCNQVPLPQSSDMQSAALLNNHQVKADQQKTAESSMDIPASVSNDLVLKQSELNHLVSELMGDVTEDDLSFSKITPLNTDPTVWPAYNPSLNDRLLSFYEQQQQTQQPPPVVNTNPLPFSKSTVSCLNSSSSEFPTPSLNNNRMDSNSNSFPEYHKHLKEPKYSLIKCDLSTTNERSLLDSTDPRLAFHKTPSAFIDSETASHLRAVHNELVISKQLTGIDTTVTCDKPYEITKEETACLPSGVTYTLKTRVKFCGKQCGHENVTGNVGCDMEVSKL